MATTNDQIATISNVGPSQVHSVSRVRAFIVDDDMTNRMVLKAMLERHGFDVSMAVNGSDAVAKFAAVNPDIVLMDLMMPEMDGLEATRRIKQASSGQFIPVIFLTATVDEAALASCVAAGGDDFLSKPYSHTLLKAKIDAQLRIRNLHQALQEQNTRLTYHENLHQEELRVAERIVNRISRVADLDLPNVRYLLKPMSTMNGDLILCASRPAGGQLFLIGDFTGHGLSAAIGGVTVYDVFYEMAAKGYGIKDIVPEMNKKIRNILPTGRFLSMAMIELETDFSTVSIFNAGMPEIYIRGDEAGVAAAFPSTHVPLGILPNDDLEIHISTVEVAPGSRIYAYSDGLVEAQNEANEMFGVERLRCCFREATDGQTLFDTIIRRLEDYRGSMEQNDDLAVLEVYCDNTSLNLQALASTSKAYRKPPMSWRMRLELSSDALQSTDPLPIVLQMLMDIQGLEEHREKLYLLLAELYSNALEHGVLGLSSDLKQTPDGFAEYYRRRALGLNALDDGNIVIDCKHTPGAERNLLSLNVINSGEGFDVSTIASKLEHNTAFAGRGIGLIRSLCDELKFHENGTHVEAAYTWEYTAQDVKEPKPVVVEADFF